MRQKGVVRSVDQVRAGDDLAIRVQDGEFEAQVTGSDDE
jgi:exonuclease VII large subunit